MYQYGADQFAHFSLSIMRVFLRMYSGLTFAGSGSAPNQKYYFSMSVQVPITVKALVFSERVISLKGT